jgi:hypothetical protein
MKKTDLLSIKYPLINDQDNYSDLNVNFTREESGYLKICKSNLDKTNSEDLNKNLNKRYNSNNNDTAIENHNINNLILIL